MRRLMPVLLACLGFASLAVAAPSRDAGRHWLAGDHHVHSTYSARYEPADGANLPPAPIIGGDSAHTILRNAQMARHFGLDWMVSTDHGGPLHSRLNHDRAWPDVVAARKAVPGLVLFYGMEFDVPGGEHASLILPTNARERDLLRAIESGFGKREAFPDDPLRNTKARMLEALRFMEAQPEPPLLIGNHPSRTATGFARWGLHAPDEYRRWAEAAPRVAIGMEGAPGHQAARPRPDLDAAHGARGLYGGYPTLGGFDQMVATLGGAWDALLGSGLRWTITANSDSHGHWREGGADFWPGEYSKTFVLARREPADILDGLRKGRVFVATGGIVDALDLTVAAANTPARQAAMGGTLATRPGDELVVTIRFRPATRANAGGAVPRVDHVDLIAGGVTGEQADRNPTTRVVRRFTSADWRRDGRTLVMQHRMRAPAGVAYLRLRGSSTAEAEPAPDVPGEDPWRDLWFYSNPVWLAPAAPGAKSVPPTG